jgi:hypothetical protein
MLKSLQRKAVATVVALGLGTASVLILASPSYAADPTAPPVLAPGDVVAFGGASALSIHLGPISYDSSTVVGSVHASNPGQDSASLTDSVLAGSPLADITLASTDTAVKSGADLAHATSDVSKTSANLFGISIVSLDTAKASADCPVSGTPEAAVTASGLRILGIPVTLDADHPTATGDAQLPASVQTTNDPADNVDLSGLTVSVKVAQVEVTTDTSAAAISLAAQVTVEGTIGTVAVPATVVASLVLASAACDAPAVPVIPFTVTGINPASGPVAGGQTVTITGTGFTPQTTVLFGTAAATGIVVSADGTSLTAVTPAGTAGVQTVTVANSLVDTATLPYTYEAPVVPVTPVTPVKPAIDVVPSKTLAATGAEPWLPAAGGLGVFVLGAGFLVAAGLRRNRA